ncbi:GNAT family N-acetyltransferase [Rhodoglobus vestalii]|uniref:GNAT family N-acetyltransferase n=1 Tax=Rhodoglobus vestalii TaxID=193384 RepID=UPI001FE99708|nr:GNAT family N-acetyltransferase [Rhodoglobus vestalii]
MAALGAAAVEVFGSFDPHYLRMWSAAPTDAFVGTHCDRRFLAAPVRNLVADGRENIPVELSLTAATDLSGWDAAAAAYDAVDAEHPGHSEQAQIADAEGFQQSIDAGTLFDIIVDDSWAGWIGVTTETSSSLGLPCYEVVEIILSPQHRGHGYGPHLNRLLAHELPDREWILMGTIHASNRGALEAARRVGRDDVGGWLQLPL